MIGHYIALIRRELWEHRSIFVTPIAIASIVTLGTLTALVFVGDFQRELNLAIFGAQNVAGETERKAVLTGLFLGSSWLFLLGLGVLTVFYALDSLYAERKDKSSLFWRSLPVTDAETVISKLLTALVVIPAVAMIGIMATHLVNLVVTSIWVSSKGGDAGMLIWGSVSAITTARSAAPSLMPAATPAARNPFGATTLMAWHRSSGALRPHRGRT